MNISKRQLKRIIKEEKSKLVSEQTTPHPHGVFDAQYITDLISAEIDDYLLHYAQRRVLTAREAKDIERAIRAATDVVYDFVD